MLFYKSIYDKLFKCLQTGGELEKKNGPRTFGLPESILINNKFDSLKFDSNDGTYINAF